MIIVLLAEFPCQRVRGFASDSRVLAGGRGNIHREKKSERVNKWSDREIVKQ